MLASREFEHLMAAVLAKPNDAAPRLVLADWFAERGDGRGELIHVGLALESDELLGDQRRACERRYAELIAGPGVAWLRELNLPSDTVTFRRGMVEGVSLPWPALRGAADRLFAWAPLQQVTTWGFDATALRQWAHSPWLPRVRELTLRDVPSQHLGAVLGPSELTPHSLTLEFFPNQASFSVEGMLRLADWSHLPRLEALGIIRGGVDDAAMHVLASAGLDVSALTLLVNNIRADGLAAVLARTRRLQTLLIGSNHLGNSLARVLDAQRAVTTLKVLGAEATGLGDEGALTIATGHLAATLTSLDLSSNELSDEGAVRLAEQATLPSLRALSVAYNRIGVRGERALRSRFEDPLRRAGGQLRV